MCRPVEPTQLAKTPASRSATTDSPPAVIESGQSRLATRERRAKRPALGIQAISLKERAFIEHQEAVEKTEEG